MQYQSLLLTTARPTDAQLRSITTFDTLLSNPDFSRVEPLEGKTSISIEQVHVLISQLSQKPFSHTHKAVLIVPADALTVPAQQALLKTLEEPPSNTLLIMATDRPHALLPTIVSRCRVITPAAKSENQLREPGRTLGRIKEIQLPRTISQAIKMAGEKGKTKEEAIQFVRELLETFRASTAHPFDTTKPKPASLQATAYAPSPLSPIADAPQLSTLLQKECLIALKLLSANVNTKLVLEHLLFTVREDRAVKETVLTT